MSGARGEGGGVVSRLTPTLEQLADLLRCSENWTMTGYTTHSVNVLDALYRAMAERDALRAKVIRMAESSDNDGLYYREQS